MHNTFLKSKIHRATVTEADVDYDGSLTIDRALMDAAGLLPHEQVHVYNIRNGERLITYVIEGARDSGVICANGAAARLVQPNDLVIIVAYTLLEPAEVPGHHPRVIHVDARNRIANC